MPRGLCAELFGNTVCVVSEKFSAWLVNLYVSCAIALNSDEHRPVLPSKSAKNSPNTAGNWLWHPDRNPDNKNAKKKFRQVSLLLLHLSMQLCGKIWYFECQRIKPIRAGGRARSEGGWWPGQRLGLRGREISVWEGPGAGFKSGGNNTPGFNFNVCPPCLYFFLCLSAAILENRSENVSVELNVHREPQRSTGTTIQRNWSQQ